MVRFSHLFVEISGDFFVELSIEAEIESTKVSEKVMKDGVERKTRCDMIFLRIGCNHENACANASQQLNHGVNTPFLRITRFMHEFMYSVVNNISSAYN